MNLETVCSELDRHFTCFEDGEAAIVKRTKGGAEAVRILIRQSTAESRVMGIPCFELEYLGGRAVL